MKSLKHRFDESGKKQEEKRERIFTDAQIESFAAYGDILRRIHERLVREGYFLSDGKTWDIFKVAKPIPYDPEDYEVYE